MVKHHLWKLIVAVALAATLVVPGASATSMVFQSPPPGPPPNNNFADATLVSSIPFSGSADIEFANLEIGEPQGPNYMSRTVWYRYDAQANMPILITATGSTFNDNNFNVYSANGPGFSSLQFMGSASYGATFSLTTTVGTTYYVQAGYLYSYFGYIQLNVQGLTAPPNDDFSAAKIIGEIPYADTSDITWATTEPSEPQIYYAYQTVWYRFIATNNGLLKADVTGSSFPDTVINVYRADGPGFAGLSSIGYTANGGSMMLDVQSGVTYYLQLGKGSACSGCLAMVLTLHLESVTPPANDNFTDAAVISGAGYYQSVDVTGATIESAEPTGNCSTPQHTVWYAFTPLANGAVSPSLWGSNGDGVLNAYRADGAGLSGLSPSLGCANNGYFSIPVQANETYYFQAGTIWSVGGNLNFSLTFIPAPANDSFANATLITTLPYDLSTDMTAASAEAGERMPSCGSASKTIWFAYTPTASGSLSQRTEAWSSSVVGVYTGGSLDTLTEVACRYRYWYESSPLTFHVNASTTYYFLLGTNDNNWLPFHLEVAPPPNPAFSYNPYDPSVFDTINFWDNSYDPAGAGIQSQTWAFGNGTTASGCCVTHRFTADGIYPIKLTITTTDGRSGVITQTLTVKTHDVAITKFDVPKSHRVGKTAQIVVGINNKRYDEDVQVQLFKSTPSGYQLFGTLQQTVPTKPRNKVTNFLFSYTFTSDDGAIGKVTFKAVANIVGARDALPADNESIAAPIKVTTK